jgi:hypothetical protein
VLAVAAWFVAIQNYWAAVPLGLGVEAAEPLLREHILPTFPHLKLPQWPQPAKSASVEYRSWFFLSSAHSTAMKRRGNRSVPREHSALDREFPMRNLGY